uniref:Phosphatidylinositol transfer protein beta isoform n=1 Tax=Ascaris suum TaxID=6253 RepID=F1L9R2_ASCSU
MAHSFYVKNVGMHIHIALNLNKNMLKKREITLLNIYEEKYLKNSDITPETDPRIFHSKLTGRGPLNEDWLKTTESVMCCYKVVQVLFKWKGIQGTIEKLTHMQYPRLFTKFHRETFCWIDRWYNLTFDELKQIDELTNKQLKKQLNDPNKRGTFADDDTDALTRKNSLTV